MRAESSAAVESRTANPEFHLTSSSSGPSGELARLGVHANFLAFFDEERYANFQSRLERRELGDAAAGRVASRARLGRRHGQLDVRGKLHSDRIAVELVDLDHEVVDEELPIVAEHLGSKRQPVEGLLIHEMVPGAVVVKIRRLDGREIRFSEFFARLE